MTATATVHITAQDHTQQAFARVRKSLEGVTHTLRHVKAEILAVAGVTGLGVLIEHAFEAGAELEKLSKKLGVSTTALSQFKHVAAVSHVSFDALTRSWQLLEKNVAAAAQGLGPAKTALQALGLSARQLKKLEVDAQFEVISEALRHVHNAADRTRLALQLFGKAGAEMLPVLVGGSAGIRALRQEADRLGLTLNEAAATQMAEAHEALVRLKSAFAGLGNLLAVNVAPVLAVVAEWLSEALPQGIQKARVAFMRLKETAVLALSSIVGVLEHFYHLLGHLPGKIGQPFQEASSAAHDLGAALFATVGQYEQTLAQLHKLEQVHHQKVKSVSAPYAAGYAVDAPRKRIIQTHQASRKSAIDALKAWQAQVEAARHATQQLQSIFANNLFTFMHEGFRSMVTNFKQSLMQMVSEAAATELTAHLFSRPASGGQSAGLFGALLGGINHFFGGFRASGGPVMPGRGYIVGEKGPEWFMPQIPGQIIAQAPFVNKAAAPISIVMHIHTPDAGSFRQAHSHLTTTLGLALQQAVKRNT